MCSQNSFAGNFVSRATVTEERMTFFLLEHPESLVILGLPVVDWGTTRNSQWGANCCLHCKSINLGTVSTESP